MEDIEFRSDVTVELVKHSASDEDVVWAARVSTAGERTRGLSMGSREPNGDALDENRSKGLINFLMRDLHGTPFEHSTMTFFVSAPIFVFREFHRHRIGFSYSEESGRYRQLKPVFYIPPKERKLVQTGKPGAYTFTQGSEGQHLMTAEMMQAQYRESYGEYEKLLELGLAREVARMVLPVGLYSTMYTTCNARSLMNFISLRTQSEMAARPSFPQREIEMVAEKMETLWGVLMPVTWRAFNKHGRQAP